MLKPKILFSKLKGTWREVADAARTTIHMDKGEGEPSKAWKIRMLMAEHSPIRLLKIKNKWGNLKSWISVHFVRHKFGIEHFVRTQRSDRTDIEDRGKLPQENPVEHEFEANPQAIINISRKRLCNQAAKETKEAWELFLEENVEKELPELKEVCVRECVYRGFCPELYPCGYSKTKKYEEERSKYVNLVKKYKL